MTNPPPEHASTGSEREHGFFRRFSDWLFSRENLSADQRKSRTTRVLALVILMIFIVGLASIIFYAVSTDGEHLQFVGVGVLTAFAATMGGTLFGFLFGVPKEVSTGSARLEASKGETVDETDGDGKRMLRAEERAARFSTSTNLAEISDWLTKLLLGASLVSLTKLGRPLGKLVDEVAGGLVEGKITGSAKVLAGSIMIAYVVMGFMVAYVATTSWYRRVLESTG